MPRPSRYRDESKVWVNSRAPESALQEKSERRAIVNFLVDNGGNATLAQIDQHFGFEIRGSVIALARIGWLEIEA